MDQFKFLSYNLEWTPKTKYISVNQLLELIKKENPDVFILQNIDASFFEKLGREMNYLGYKRYFSENYQSRKHNDIMFSKLPVIGTKFYEYQKNTDRNGIFLLEISYNNRLINIASTQIDNLPYLQSHQLGNLNKILEKHIDSSEAIILGIDTKAFEYSQITTNEGWYDAWYEVGTDKEKYTLDSSKNHMAQHPYKDRPDRIWYKSYNKNFSCDNFGFVGMDMDISPHYGIMCTFSF